MDAKLIQVIEARGLRGGGTDKDPQRNITAYFALDGTLLAEVDPWKDEQQSQAAARWRAQE